MHVRGRETHHLRWLCALGAAAWTLSACTVEFDYAEPESEPGQGSPFDDGLPAREFDQVLDEGSDVLEGVTERPDAVPLAIAIDPQDPHPGDAVAFTVAVANQGEAPFERELVVSLSIVGVGGPAMWAQADVLPPGQSRELSLSQPFVPSAPGTYFAVAAVDGDNLLAESDEQNNWIELSFEVTTPKVTCTCKPDFTNMCDYPPSTQGAACAMTLPFGYCDPNGDGHYTDGDWERGWEDYQVRCP